MSSPNSRMERGAAEAGGRGIARLVRRLRRGQRGQALVELALVLPLMLLMIGGIAELGRYYYTRLSVRHATLQAARYATTGGTATDPVTGVPLTRSLSIDRQVRDRARALGVEIGGVAVTPPGGGTPGQVVQVRVEYSYRFALPVVREILPRDLLRFNVAVAMRNEPF